MGLPHTGKKAFRQIDIYRAIALVRYSYLYASIYYIVVNFNSILMAFQTYNLSEGKYVFLNAENGGLFANFSAFIKDLTIQTEKNFWATKLGQALKSEQKI